jgi:hypothetical protein
MRCCRACSASVSCGGQSLAVGRLLQQSGAGVLRPLWASWRAWGCSCPRHEFRRPSAAVLLYARCRAWSSFTVRDSFRQSHNVLPRGNTVYVFSSASWFARQSGWGATCSFAACAPLGGWHELPHPSQAAAHASAGTCCVFGRSMEVSPDGLVDHSRVPSVLYPVQGDSVTSIS